MNMSKELLFSITKDDFEIDRYCSASTNGGQNANKVASAVRILHKKSGATGKSVTERDQHKNLKIAFRRCVDSDVFQLWLKRKIGETLTGKSIDQIVEELMNPKNLKIETKDEFGKWREENESLC